MLLSLSYPPRVAVVCCRDVPYRLIPDPPNRECLVNESVGQADGTSTAVNKRKHAATSTSSASSSLSSLASSSAPSSPGSEVDREARIPGKWTASMFPRRTQMAKRPRLDLAPSGSGVTASSVQARQTLAPPPVFGRRPATPFNCPPGETGGTGNQAEGSGYVEGSGNDEVEAGGDSPDTLFGNSSDDSLSRGYSRRR